MDFLNIFPEEGKGGQKAEETRQGALEFGGEREIEKKRERKTY